MKSYLSEFLELKPMLKEIDQIAQDVIIDKIEEILSGGYKLAFESDDNSFQIYGYSSMINPVLEDGIDPREGVSIEFFRDTKNWGLTIDESIMLATEVYTSEKRIVSQYHMDQYMLALETALITDVAFASETTRLIISENLTYNPQQQEFVCNKRIIENFQNGKLINENSVVFYNTTNTKGETNHVR